MVTREKFVRIFAVTILIEYFLLTPAKAEVKLRKD